MDKKTRDFYMEQFILLHDRFPTCYKEFLIWVDSLKTTNSRGSFLDLLK